MPKVSIILPVYNAANYLRECVDSVIAQTFWDWELIAVDDGSSDGSSKILDDFAAHDSRIRVIHKHNMGAWVARNDSLKVALGEWVTFIDADDMYAPYWFDEALRCVDEHHPDLIRQNLFCGDAIPSGFNVPPQKLNVYCYTGQPATDWCWRIFPSGGFLWRCFVQRKLTVGIRFRPVINCKEDSIWLMELIPRIGKVCETDCVGYFYRTVPVSLSKRIRDASQCVAYIDALRDIWNMQYDWCKSLGLMGLICRELSVCADDEIIEEIQKGEGTQFDPDIVKYMVDMINDGYVNVVKMETADNDEGPANFQITESDIPGVYMGY